MTTSINTAASSSVIGDPKIYGRCYIAAGGRGILYGDIPDQPPFAPANLVATPPIRRCS